MREVKAHYEKKEGRTYIVPEGCPLGKRSCMLCPTLEDVGELCKYREEVIYDHLRGLLNYTEAENNLNFKMETGVTVRCSCPNSVGFIKEEK